MTGPREVDRVQRALREIARVVRHVETASPPIAVHAEVVSLAALPGARLRLLVHGYLPVEPQAADCHLYVVDDWLTGERRVELRCVERA